MTTYLAPETLAQVADVRPAPAAREDIGRSFELPVALHGFTVAAYLGFLAVMAVGLPTPHLIVPIAICAIFVIMAFTVPALWALMRPDTNRGRAMDWNTLKRIGVPTHTGTVMARDAAIQVLILPTLIFAWGLIVVTIAALV
jgi:hypothetical protein